MDNFIWDIISIHLRGAIYTRMLQKGFWIDSEENLYTMLFDTKLQCHINKFLCSYCDYIVDIYDIESVYQKVLDDMITNNIFTCYFKMNDLIIFGYDYNNLCLALSLYLSKKYSKKISISDIKNNIQYI